MVSALDCCESDLFRTNYEAWIGYQAILQDKGRNDEVRGIDPDTLEKLFELDRVNHAVKQAAKTVESQHRAMRAAQAEG